MVGFSQREQGIYPKQYFISVFLANQRIKIDASKKFQQHCHSPLSCLPLSVSAMMVMLTLRRL